MKRLAFVFGICLFVLGCDDKPAPPKLDEAKPVETMAGPTTRDLLTGPRKTIPLSYIPMKVTAPVGWQVEADSAGAMAFLKGPTPAGNEVQIQLSQRPTMKNDGLEFLIAGAKEKARKDTSGSSKVDLRHDGSVAILERQSVGEPFAAPSGTDEKSVADTSPEYRWTINFFVPRNRELLQYEMNFLGLTVKQFKADQTFLESILRTVTPETSGEPANGAP